MHMAALRAAAVGKGALLDGTIACLLAQIEVERLHARLTPREAGALTEFGLQLQRRSPAPNVVVHLETTPVGLDARARPDESLAIGDHEVLDACIRQSVSSLTGKGGRAELYARKWDRFGKTAAVRDAILCTPPPDSTAKTLTPPSVAAVERLLDDAWAAATQQSMPASDVPRRRSASRGDLAPPTSPSLSTCGSDAICSEGSPVSVYSARLDDSPVGGGAPDAAA